MDHGLSAIQYVLRTSPRAQSSHWMCHPAPRGTRKGQVGDGNKERWVPQGGLKNWRTRILDALVAIGGSVADGEFMNSSKLVLWLELDSNEGGV